MIKCHYCSEYTNSLEPLVLKKIGDCFSLSCICSKCTRTKSRFLKSSDTLLLPDIIKNNICKGKTYINTFFINSKSYNFYEILKDRINE